MAAAARRLAQETHEVQAQIHTTTPESLDLEGALAFASGVLTDPVACWQRLAPEQRPGFQRAIYPGGLDYQDGSFGTAESSWAFGYFQDPGGSDGGLVSPGGFEPPLPA